MKKTSIILLALLLLASAFSLIGCVNGEKQPFSYSENEDGTLTLTGRGWNTSTNVVVPTEYNGKSVTKIADYAFKGTNIVSLTIGNHITNIGCGIVSDCGSLTSLSVPYLGSYDGDTANAYVGYFFGTSKGKTASRSLISFTVLSAPRLETDALCGLRALEFFIIPSDTTYIGDRTFEGCSSLTSLSGINSNITYIGYHAFNTTKLAKLEIAAPSSALQDDCLYGIEGLAELKLDLSGIASGHEALVYLFDSRLAEAYFANTPNPTFATSNSIIPSTLTKVELIGTGVADYALCGTKVTDVSIANTVTTVGDAAFASCLYISQVSIPDSVLSLGDYAFIHCSRLESVTFGLNITSIGSGAFTYCQKLKTVDFNACIALTTLNAQAFQYCTSIETLTLPSSLKRIETGCFQGVKSLASITIPSAVNYIGVNAFDQCTALTAITFVQKTGWKTVNGYAKPDLSNVKTNVTHLTETYVTYSWSR